MFLQDSIVKEDKFGQDSAIAETPLLEIEGQWERSSFSNEWHSFAISIKDSSSIEGKFHNERTLSEGQPRAIAVNPDFVTLLVALIESLPNPPRPEVPTAMAASLPSVAFFPSIHLVRNPSFSGEIISTSVDEPLSISEILMLLRTVSHRFDTQAEALRDWPPGNRRRIS